MFAPHVRAACSCRTFAPHALLEVIAARPGLRARPVAWVDMLEQLAQEPTRSADVQALLRCAYEVAAAEHFEALRMALAGKAPHVEDAMQTMYELLVEKGRAEGKAEGKRQLLERLVETKLGALPDEVRARLARASEAELPRVSDRVRDARSFADLFP